MDLVWKPNKKQEAFVEIPDTIFEALYGGAAGGGKSELLVLLPMLREWYKHPRFKGILFRRTYPELEAELIVRSHQFYPHFGGKYNSEKKRWQWPTGSIIQFGHMEYESDARKYDSAEYNYIAFDELTSFTRFQYTYLYSRCRSSSRDLPAILRSATNPGNIGHAWVRKHFVEPAPYGTLVLDKTTGLKRIFIQATVKDNKDNLDPNYENVLSALPEAERRAKRDGDWWTFEGQVFDDWRTEQFSDEPSNALHVIDPFEIPDWWPRVLAIDWGFSAMTIALWGALSPDRRLYVYREYTSRNCPISTWATEVGKMSQNEKIDDTVLCQSAWQSRGEDPTIADQFRKYSGLLPRSSDNDKGSRILGKLLIQEYLRWHPRPQKKIPQEGFSLEKAHLILRNKGQAAYDEYVSFFQPELPETNLPKLQVFRGCDELIKTIPLCVYDDKDRQTGKPAEDVKEFNGDDPYDCARYLVRAADLISRDATRQGNFNLNIVQAAKKLEADNDMTSFQRKMHHLASQRPKVVPIRRFRHAGVA